MLSFGIKLVSFFHSTKSLHCYFSLSSSEYCWCSWGIMYVFYESSPLELGSLFLLSPMHTHFPSQPVLRGLPLGSQSKLEFQIKFNISLAHFFGKSRAKIFSKLPFLKWDLPKLSLCSTIGVQDLSSHG